MHQEVYFTNIRKKIIENIRSCNSEIKIAVAWFTDKKIIKEVNELIKRNVNVEIIIYDDHVNKKELFKELYYNNAKIFLSKNLMHNKFCVIDNQTVINGSYNWTIKASTNEENIQITYNDYEFAKKFIDNFYKLASKCKTIDNHFEYSLSNLLNLKTQFNNFYSKWPNYTFPYFINTLNIKPSKENKFSTIFGYIYFIKNKEEEKIFLWYYYFLQSKYSVAKLQKLEHKKLKLSQKYKFIHNIRFDKNNVSEFLKDKYIVEEHKKNNYNSSKPYYYLYAIDKNGEAISEKMRFTYKVNNELYIMHITNMFQKLKPYFLNNKLQKTYIPYYVMEVLSNYSMIVSNYENTTSKKGILDINNKIVVPFKYNNWVRIVKESYVDLIEYPILYLTKSSKYFQHPLVDYNNYKRKRHIIFRYSIPEFSLIKTIPIKGSEDLEDDIYIFLSEDNYKYSFIYKKILQMNMRLTLAELNELKENYQNKTKVNSLIRKFNYNYNKKPEKKEGCYIATMVYKDYNSKEVIILRKYRDNTLSKSIIGRLLIKVYYFLSPSFVKVFENNKMINTGIKYIIDILIKRIK